jgi:hypothetical protein
VEEWKWIKWMIAKRRQKNPGDYTVWFRIALEKMTEKNMFQSSGF